MKNKTAHRPLSLIARPLPVFLLAAVFFCNGCSMQKVLANKLGSTLASGGTTFSSDDDPELVGGALPFSLKLMETVLAETPQHVALLVATSRGFTQYSYGWVEQPAVRLADSDLQTSEAELRRAARLYLRARNYGLRALAVRYDNFRVRLLADPVAAVARVRKEDVPALYWTAAAWGLAISISQDQPEVVADLPIVEALIRRAAELDPEFEAGAIHNFLAAYEVSRAGTDKAAVERARNHFKQALKSSRGEMASPFLTMAESVAASGGDRAEFESLLTQALAIPADQRPEWRLQNLLDQRKAAWLLARAGDFFPTTESEEEEDEK